MPRNHKLTAIVPLRPLHDGWPAKLIIVFDDQSTMTVKTVGKPATFSTGARVNAVLEDGDHCTLQFEDAGFVTAR